MTDATLPEMTVTASGFEEASSQDRTKNRSSELNQLDFFVRSMLSDFPSAVLVKVVSCENNGGLSPSGFVNVIPMIHQVDGGGKPVPHGVIPRVPYLRIHGGSNAIIIDPQPGDIGICVVTHRDSEKVKNTRQPAPPDSERMNDLCDSVYIGGVLTAAPTQYLQFVDGGVVLHGTGKVSVTAENVYLGSESGARRMLLEEVKGLYNDHTHNVTGNVTEKPNQQMTDNMLTEISRAT